MWINLNYDKYDELPYKESRYKYITRKYGNMYNISKFDHPWMRYSNSYKLVFRILNNNINKSFDLAFSYYCKKVDKQHQYLFLREFEYQNIHRYFKNRGYWIDENKIIRYN